MNDLDVIVALSHEFGTPDYVKGGGGNTSAKTADTLWVKPSGTTLAGIAAGDFVTMDRARLDRLFAVQPPAEAAAREALVKDMMAAAVTGPGGRPSVEAPLHNVFDATFVVHTHPALVNGLTCAAEGAAACARLFPDALWVRYVDPGYTLCIEVRRAMEAYRARHGRQPTVVVLQNHGVFIAGNTAAEIRRQYQAIMTALADAYRQAGVATELRTVAAPAEPGIGERLRACFGGQAAFHECGDRFAWARGPLSPDHLVYARAFAFDAPLVPAQAAQYQATHGFPPNVVVTPQHVYGIGKTAKQAALALTLARDGALVQQLTTAFGGVAFMSEAARRFIENWEVESYRQQVATR